MFSGDTDACKSTKYIRLRKDYRAGNYRKFVDFSLGKRTSKYELQFLTLVWKYKPSVTVTESKTKKLQ